ncbi:hypothetical protein E2562_018259 [Oryza meyeriana var. granulata]|uniref:Uncharacterized protein n=1 Tax=Oryza meyeriana var. granulata TaxID=110450 RepID=A0A6G1CQ75_9ORYZ|nr:hypothetical protein E2562_018259 [Oryza meyeriana var. granulata]
MAPGATTLSLGSDGGVQQWWYSAYLRRQRGCLSLAAVPDAAQPWWKSARCSAVVLGAGEMRHRICGQGSVSALVATIGETTNPSSIPKHVWLIFTSSARDVVHDTLTITEKPPEHWQQGGKHCVFVHLEEIQDYTSATVTLDEQATCAPAKRWLPAWHLGIADSEPAPARAFSEFPHHPIPPRSYQFQGGWDKDRNQRDRGREGRNNPRKKYNDDHPNDLRGNS